MDSADYAVYPAELQKLGGEALQRDKRLYDKILINKLDHTE